MHGPFQSGRIGTGLFSVPSTPVSGLATVARAVVPLLTEGHPTTRAPPPPVWGPVAWLFVRVSTRGDYASSGPALARPPRRRDADLGPGHRRAHRAAPAVPRADPPGPEGGRTRPLQTRGRGRLRAGPAARGDLAGPDRLGRRRPHRRRRLRGAPRQRRLRPRRASASCSRSGPMWARRSVPICSPTAWRTWSTVLGGTWPPRSEGRARVAILLAPSSGAAPSLQPTLRAALTCPAPGLSPGSTMRWRATRDPSPAR